MKKLTWKKEICEVKVLDTEAVEKQETQWTRTRTATDESVLESVACNERTQRNQDVSFERAVWPILAVVQFCGILPVCGIRRSRLTPQATKFKWLSVRVIYSVFFQVSIAVFIYLYLTRLKVSGFTAKRLAGVIVMIISLSSCVLFFLLARRWRPLISCWNRTDAIFLRKPYGLSGFRLSTKIRCMAGFWLLAALLEHIVYLVQKVFVMRDQIRRCGWQVDDYLQHFLVAEHNYIFERVTYSTPLGLLVIWLNTTAIVGWSCADILIMICSLGVTQRYLQINSRLQALKPTRIAESTWTEIRTHYVLVCELLDMVDDNLGLLIVLSCTNNMAFICFQLLNTFNKLPYTLNYVYFWFSLGFLISRTVCVFLSAASIHDASAEPAAVIRSVLTADWSVEAERMMDQVNNEKIALSGMKFFHLTRKVLLGMIGTIVTYELVLLQFDKNDLPPLAVPATFCKTSSRVT